MSNALVRNLTLAPIPLPLPYRGILAAGALVILADTPDNVITNFGGSDAVRGVLDVLPTDQPASGNNVIDPGVVAHASLVSAITDSILAAGSVVYRKNTGNLGINTGLTEAIATAIEGVADQVYAATAAAKFYTDGQLATGLSGLTPGTEYFAKEDGSLAVIGSVGSGKWTRSMGVAETATTLRVQRGIVQQIP